MNAQEYNLLVAMIALQQSIEDVRMILEAEERREHGKFLSAVQK